MHHTRKNRSLKKKTKALKKSRSKRSLKKKSNKSSRKSKKSRRVNKRRIVGGLLPFGSPTEGAEIDKGNTFQNLTKIENIGMNILKNFRGLFIIGK